MPIYKIEVLHYRMSRLTAWGYPVTTRANIDAASKHTRRNPMRPSNLNIQLFPYQFRIIQEMEEYEATRTRTGSTGTIFHSNVGINADKIGYGKTLEMIGLVCRDQMPWDLSDAFEHVYTKGWSKDNCSGYIRSEIRTVCTRIKSTLIVVARGLVGQWQHELGYSTLSTKTIVSKKDSLDGIEQYDVVLVADPLANQVINVMNERRLAWKRFIMDEPGQLAIPNMSSPTAGMMWFLTATPNDIQTRYQTRKRPNLIADIFFKEVFDRCWTEGTTVEEAYSDIIFRNDDAFVQESYRMPATLLTYHSCYHPVADVVQCVEIESNIKRMVHAGDIQGALSMLGGQNTDNLIELLQERTLRAIQKVDMELTRLKEKEDEADEWELPLILEFQQKHAQRRTSLAAQLETIQEKYNAMIHDECPICRLTLDNPVLEPYCQNLFCAECLLTWMKLRTTCPMCRKALQFNDIKPVVSTGSSQRTKADSRLLTTPETVSQLICTNPTGKFLVSSAFRNAFEPISAHLRDEGIQYTSLNGTVARRKKDIEAFRTGSLNVILLNTTEHAAGLNLPETTDIIITHDMDDTTKTQIIGRGLRVGRTKPLNVHVLQ